MTITEIIARDKELREKATPGPWKRAELKDAFGRRWTSGIEPDAEDPYLVETHYNHAGSSFSRTIACPAHGHDAEEGQDAFVNMDLIAHSVNSMPILIAALERAREALGYYADPTHYEERQTLGGLRPPGVLVESGRKARDVLRGIE